MRKTLNATEMRQFVEALEKQGLIPELARLVKKDPSLAKKIVETVAWAFLENSGLEDMKSRLKELDFSGGNGDPIDGGGGSCGLSA